MHCRPEDEQVLSGCGSLHPMPSARLAGPRYLQDVHCNLPSLIRPQPCSIADQVKGSVRNKFGLISNLPCDQESGLRCCFNKRGPHGHERFSSGAEGAAMTLRSISCSSRLSKAVKQPCNLQAVAKLRSSLQQGQPYDGQQMFKTIYHRFRAQKRLQDCYNLLEEGARLQLQDGQLNCGVELAQMLVEVLL